MRRVPLFYDFAVPACFVAHERARRLAAAVPGAAFEWVPWEARPELPVPGLPRPPGERVLGPALQERFAELALPFKPSRLLPNSRVALRAALWCEARGGGEDLRDGVYRRLYERGLENHLHDPEVLAGIVERSGLDPIAFLDDLREGWGLAALREARARADALGVRSVPTLALGRGLVPGDAPPAELEAALRKVVAEGSPQA